jgi:hypothetical protein
MKTDPRRLVEDARHLYLPSSSVLPTSHLRQSENSSPAVCTVLGKMQSYNKEEEDDNDNNNNNNLTHNIHYLNNNNLTHNIHYL